MSMVDDGNEDDGLAANIAVLAEKVGKEFKGMGLYVENISPMAQPTQEMMDDPRAALAGGEHLPFAITLRFNKLALTDRMLFPEESATKDEFSKIMPTEAEMIRAKVAERLAEGKDPLDLG